MVRGVVYLICDQCFSVVLFLLMVKPGWIVSAIFSHGCKLRGEGGSRVAPVVRSFSGLVSILKSTPFWKT